MIAVIPNDNTGGDKVIAFRFAVDDVREGPEVTYFHDDTNEGCGIALCWALTGISGSHKFAVQMKSHASKHGDVSNELIRSLQVIAITDATILVNKTSSAADDAVSGYTNIVGLTDTKTVASGSVLLLLGNMPIDLSNAGAMWGLRFTIAGSHEGPELIAHTDGGEEGCGQSMMWAKSGISGSTAFALQWDEKVNTVAAETARVRSLQVIQITANVNKLTAQVSQTADAIDATYTDVLGMSDTVTVDATGSILIFAAGVGSVLSHV
ncbi:MAG: hypothetical protein IID43_01280 [Planctomycetes bacterium]|nr:hypothetical protein [Planctomycetota bacterium]